MTRLAARKRETKRGFESRLGQNFGAMQLFFLIKK